MSRLWDQLLNDAASLFVLVVLSVGILAGFVLATISAPTEDNPCLFGQPGAVYEIQNGTVRCDLNPGR